MDGVDDLDAVVAELRNRLSRHPPGAHPVQHATTRFHLGVALRAGDDGAVGAAANVLGLVRLAADRPEAAIDALRSAVVASPRHVRPQGHAVAKANLALAYEQVGDAPRARLAARQAAFAPGAPEVAVRQAAAVLERLGEADDDLFTALEDEPPECWTGVIREEIVRLAGDSDAGRRAAVGAWVRSLYSRPDRAVDLIDAWLAVLLELPPPDLEDAARAMLAAVAAEGGEAAARIRGWLSAAMPRFHVPQWFRLEETFKRLASEEGPGERWG